MTAEVPFSPEELDLVERRQDQGVWNGAMGELAVRGTLAENDDDPRPSDKKPKRRHRAGHESGDHEVTLGPGDLFADEASRAAYERVRSEFDLLRDSLVVKRLREEVASGEITPALARAKWVKHQERHNKR